MTRHRNRPERPIDSGDVRRTSSRHKNHRSPPRLKTWGIPAAALTALFAFLIYSRTMAPTITWRNGGSDSGDLVTAAINLGVPHPSGYPVYTMLAHLFAIPPAGEPARNVAFLSALAAALAVGTVFWTTYRLLTLSKDGVAQSTPKAVDLLVLVVAWAAAGLYGFGELLWSQATIAEVYSVYALIVALFLALAHSETPQVRPYVAAFLFGLGLAHHLTIVLLLPALWPYFRMVRGWLTPRRLIAVGLCLVPGLLAYLYIPIRAGAHPVPNWGQADNLSGFVWLVSGAAYRRYLGVLPQSYLLQRLSAWTGIWVRDFGVLGIALALLGLWDVLETDRRFAWFGMTYTASLTLYSMLYSTSDSYLYLLPVAMIIALWMARGAIVALRGLQSWARSGSRLKAVTVLALLILGALPLISVATRFGAMDLSADREAYTFAEGVLDAAAPNAVVISSGDLQTFALWYLRYGLGKRPDVTIVDRNLLAFDWYRDDLALQHQDLATIARARDADEAAFHLVRENLGHPIHLTYSDASLLSIAVWTHDGSLFTLSRN